MKLNETGGQERGLAGDANVGITGVQVARGTAPLQGQDPGSQWCTEACSTQAVDVWEMKG